MEFINGVLVKNVSKISNFMANRVLFFYENSFQGVNYSDRFPRGCGFSNVIIGENPDRIP
jgi:hypothetical protein